ncbi:toll-like receptor 1 [Electrophorus electricus]|uniref:TIR domain-containing protein n=1 Tax=Electrophorus electricus TaxID=8005 RepID=A0A4W4GLN8_ELEEL|nr:toll-like receptor 1 [Electrophorus electricus]
MPTNLWVIAVPSLLLLMFRPTVLINEDKTFQLCSSMRENSKDLSYHNLTGIPQDLPDGTEYLDISHNNISSIVRADLCRLSRLCSLKITHCGLQLISADAFYNNSQLKVLNMSYNHLTIISYLPLPQLRILDLSCNRFDSYALPGFFRNLTHLTTFAIGSTKATSVDIKDLTPLQNTSLKWFSFGCGSDLQKYENGSFAQLKSLQEVALRVTLCKSFDIFTKMIMDLDQVHTKKVKLHKLFPDKCTILSDPFEIFKELRILSNITIVDTWINSSIMVKLIQNIWKSSFEELVFLNITYNEDTPHGFQFPSQNHTTNLRAIVFDGVKHYQYQYPTVNMSMDLISQLTYMKFSGTGMNILPCKLISVIPSLQILDLSDNLLDDTGFWWFSCSYEDVFPALRHLSLSHNRFYDLAFISKKTYEMKVLTSLDLSFNSIYIGEPCYWPSHLTELNLSHNNLGNTIFNYLSPQFKKIDLSKTGISAISQDVLSQFPRLTHLFLSFNSIQCISFNLHAHALQTLYVDQNAMTSIGQDELKGLTSLETLKAGNNPFVCNCDSFWFVTVFNKSLLPDWPLDYTCSTPQSQAGKYLESYQQDKFSCMPGLQAAVALPVVIVITVALGIIFYAFDGIWYTKMLWVWIRVKRCSSKRADRLMNASFRYHAFISYSQHDSAWVDTQLVPGLEGSGLSICIHERDFVPGQWIIDNIISCVEGSYKTLFVLSNSFVQSEWCNYELFFAQHRAISVNEDSLVFILLEPIPTDSLPKKFLKLRTLLRKQTYLEWPKDEHKKTFFWSSLKAILRAADKSIILKEAALDMTETCPLLSTQG